MSTRKSKRVFTAGFAALLAIGLAACGGGSNNVADDPPASALIDLMGSTDLNVGDTTIPAGQSVTVGATTIMCPEDGDDCMLSISKDPVTGAYTAMATGGTPTVAVAPPPMPPTPTTVDLMGSMDLMAGTTTIPAGSSTTIGYTTVSCPEGDDACVLTVVKDSVTGGYTATATGGVPTVAVAEPPMPTTVDLMGSMDLMAGTTTIPAGSSTEIGNTTVSCPEGDDACVLTVVKDSVTGGYTATATGGIPTVAVVHPVMVDLMGSTDLGMGTITIAAGESRVVGRTTVECPEGGDDCVLTVAKHSVTGEYTATSIGGVPMVSVAPIVHYADLPKVHDLMAGEMFTVGAGDSVEIGGVEFTCPEGGGDCEVTIMQNEDGDLVASYTGGAEGLVSMQLTPRGYLAFIHSNPDLNDLSDTILDPVQLADLMQNIYHGSRLTGGSGVTSSVTTHEDPSIGDPNVTGVSDIMVSVTTSATDPTRDDDSHRIVVVDPGADGTKAAPDYEIMEAMHKDSSTSWTGDIGVTATWAANPAAGWTVSAMDLDSEANMDDNDEDVWTAYFQHEQSLDGGRTLELDLRTDFVPGHARHIIPFEEDDQIIIRGPGGTHDEVTVDWIDVMFDNELYDNLRNNAGGELTVPGDGVNGGMGLEGGYRADDGHFLRGRFVCIDGGAAGGTADQECEVDHQTPGELSTSEGDIIVFLPYVHGADANWLAAGVWLTIPQDEENGDYAVGAFVFGNDPVEADETYARARMGTATYNGDAFGRYARNGMIDAQAMEVGRFTADVTLTADFGDESGPGATNDNNFGAIRGRATGFVANGNPEDWDVRFESAMIMLGDDPANPGQPLDGTALRFNGTASGHGDGGKATTGYWNGQFYGDPQQPHNDDDPIQADIQTPWGNELPGSAAGTFGLTSERDTSDNYLLVLEGAYAAHQDDALDAPHGGP